MQGIDISALIMFGSALTIAAAIPGPATTAIVARVLVQGTRDLVPFLFGLILTDVFWLAFAVTGLAVMAQTFQEVFIAIKYIGASYLLWLAWRFWKTPVTSTPSEPLEMRGRGISTFFGGLTLGMANPKSMMFYLALLPSFVPLHAVTPFTFMELAIATFSILAVVFSAYVLAAAQARSLFSSPRSLTIINKLTGGIMVGMAVVVATR